MKCNIISLLWTEFFLNIVNNRECVYNHCKRPPSRSDRHCREWYIYNNTDGDDIRMLDDEMNIYGAYW